MDFSVVVITVISLIIIMGAVEIFTGDKEEPKPQAPTYIKELSFEQFNSMVMAVFLENIKIAIRDDTVIVASKPKSEKYKEIYSNALVRTVTYLNSEKAIIDKIYGDDYVIKLCMRFYESLQIEEELEKLIKRYNNNA